MQIASLKQEKVIRYNRQVGNLIIHYSLQTKLIS